MPWGESAHGAHVCASLPADSGLKPSAIVAQPLLGCEDMSDTMVLDPPILDAATIGGLQALGADILGEIFELFAVDAPARLARLENAIQSGSRDAVLREAHGLKGTALGVGAARMATLCAAIESDARTGQLSDAAERSACLKSEVQAVRHAFGSIH